ncbi:MAG: DUF896 domain-containing protein [Bacillota bacterium]
MERKKLLDKEEINRINFLAKKSKKDGLNDKEKEEQKKLRKKYLKSFRKSFKKRLDNVKVVKDKETYEKMMKEKEDKK